MVASQSLSSCTVWTEGRFSSSSLCNTRNIDLGSTEGSIHDVYTCTPHICIFVVENFLIIDIKFKKIYTQTLKIYITYKDVVENWEAWLAKTFKT